MKVLITGADGFIGKNLQIALAECEEIEVIPVTRSTAEAEIERAVTYAHSVIHLAGANRPRDPKEFTSANSEFTANLCNILRRNGSGLPIAYASSIQAGQDNAYGRSKLDAEKSLSQYSNETGASAAIYRFPNVFGKWCRPNYNSVVATFCHNISRGLPIQVNDPETRLRLIYVDDVVAELLRFLKNPTAGVTFGEVIPEYSITVADLADQIRAFEKSRISLVTERVGTGLARALYATYMSYLDPSSFSYGVPDYRDQRGVFVEMLRTKDSGQVSFFTASAGITRGGHYHHSKTEKFLVIKGRARFRFRHILTDELYILHASGEVPVVVESIPGWAHDVTNVGDDELVVMLWANEVFDRTRPDTIASKL